MDESRLAILIAVAIILLVSFPVHEFSHALAAFRLGDGTAKLFGRLTLNPIVHFDPIGGLMLIVSGLIGGIGFGWAKPTPVNPMNLRGGREAEAIVAFAGPASNLVLAAAAALPLRFIIHSPTLSFDVPGVVQFVLYDFVLINLALAIFNLIPIPPLDGSKVLYSFLPPRVAYQWRPILDQYGFFLLILLIIPIGPGGAILSQIFTVFLDPLLSLLLGI
ncbi:MAG TPA: site-2 protease family protein [Candidatus Limnocylindrales bacterium]|nr:site-2 protease family protein [Candidatus Limnocylindrales bacterium]